MFDQPSLFDGPPDPIDEAFGDFHARHPEVEEYMAGLAFYLFQKGRKHYAIKALYERARWHFDVEKDMGEEFKLNNNFHSRYARLIMRLHPQLDGFFELRKLKKDRENGNEDEN